MSICTKSIHIFAGADLMRLTREDLIQICGLADGIRLNNSMQAKLVVNIWISVNQIFKI